MAIHPKGVKEYLVIPQVGAMVWMNPSIWIAELCQVRNYDLTNSIEEMLRCFRDLWSKLRCIRHISLLGEAASPDAFFGPYGDRPDWM